MANCKVKAWCNINFLMLGNRVSISNKYLSEMHELFKHVLKSKVYEPNWTAC